ncbi:response regulator transcription factor [Desulfosporosinus sp. FKA]|uniref:response regulator transcription factor n=1 Tax=Desulfosporosinus sp. FKA TaxID=1969834 RepID=UPI000B49E04F|nr:response regulator transcription factor [Desulfosporosinus sp. FKA]
MARILIVEDEHPINELIYRNLLLVGHDCLQVYDGMAAIEETKKQSFDLIILDVLLPSLSGFEVLERIRSIPVIFLTAKDGLSDRVKGLNLGADDYIVKPFETLELLARVEAVLRRTQKHTKLFQLVDAEINLESRKAYYQGLPVDLAPREFELLETLILNRNVALSREKLLELAWGYDYIGDMRTVDVHIQKLRKKLGWETCIHTVYKLGYRLEV